MKIAFFANSYLPYVSGVTVCVSTLTKYLRKAGHEVYLFVPSYPGHKEADPYVFRLPSLPSTYPGFRLTIPVITDPKAYEILKGVDVIHTHTPFGLGLLGMFLAKRYKKPYVFTFHTLFKHYLHHVPFLPKKLGEIFLSIYLRLFCHGCRLILAPSKKIKEYLRAEKVKSNIAILPGGVDFERIDISNSKKIREGLKLKDSDPLLVYCGRVTKEKNIGFLLRAFMLIQKKNKKAYLIIVGGGPNEEHLKKMAKGLNVFFVGKKSPSEVFDYFSAADLFVFASKTETQGLVVSEAKAVGLPAVVVDEAGVSESVVNGEDGYLVPEDEQIFADKCLSILLNPELKQTMGEKARLNAINHFSAEKIATELTRIYSGLNP